MLSRILYVYHARNSESGYAQGMNDIVAPFIIAFAKEHIELHESTLIVKDGFEILLTD